MSENEKSLAAFARQGLAMLEEMEREDDGTNDD